MGERESTLVRNYRRTSTVLEGSIRSPARRRPTRRLDRTLNSAGQTTAVLFGNNLFRLGSVGGAIPRRVSSIRDTASEASLSDDSTRAELQTEYFKLADFVQHYDSYFLTIKAWGVGSSGAAVALGFAKADWGAFVVALTLSMAFWSTEVRYKLLQLAHMRRLGELESQLQGQAKPSPGPRIFSAFSEESGLNNSQSRWRSVLFWPQVMYPHAFFASISLLGLLVLVAQALTA
jgi:hypothetical protein